MKNVGLWWCGLGWCGLVGCGGGFGCGFWVWCGVWGGVEQPARVSQRPAHPSGLSPRSLALLSGSRVMRILPGKPVMRFYPVRFAGNALSAYSIRYGLPLTAITGSPFSTTDDKKNSWKRSRWTRRRNGGGTGATLR